MATNKGTEQKLTKAQANREIEQSKKKKKSMYTLVAVLLIVAIVFGALIYNAEEKVNMENLVFGDDIIIMDYFHLSTCPHCLKQNVYNKYLSAKFPNLKIQTLEMSQNGFLSKYQNIADRNEGLDKDKFPGTPLTIINEKEFNIGYGSDETSGKKILEMIQAEQKKIDDNWDTETMTRTITLREQTE